MSTCIAMNTVAIGGTAFSHEALVPPGGNDPIPSFIDDDNDFTYFVLGYLDTALREIAPCASWLPAAGEVVACLHHAAEVWTQLRPVRGRFTVTVDPWLDLRKKAWAGAQGGWALPAGGGPLGHRPSL